MGNKAAELHYQALPTVCEAEFIPGLKELLPRGSKLEEEDVMKKPAAHVSKKPAAHVSTKPAAHVAKKPAAHVSKKPAAHVAKKPAAHVVKKPATRGGRQNLSWFGVKKTRCETRVCEVALNASPMQPCAHNLF